MPAMRRGKGGSPSAASGVCRVPKLLLFQATVPADRTGETHFSFAKRAESETNFFRDLPRSKIPHRAAEP